MSVKRYSIAVGEAGLPVLVPAENGRVMLTADYAALEAELHSEKVAYDRLKECHERQSAILAALEAKAETKVCPVQQGAKMLGATDTEPCPFCAGRQGPGHYFCHACNGSGERPVATGRAPGEGREGGV